jgi:monoterpene epsilon-lactone hydrolase
MNTPHPSFVETQHPLPDGEGALAQAAVAALMGVLIGGSGSDRDRYAAMIATTPIAEGVTTDPVDRDGVHGWWVRPAKAPSDRAILYVHGGGYRLGSAKAYRGFASQIAVRAGLAAFVADYPLAPEHPFPAGLDAVLAVRRWLATQGITRAGLAGDSAGGGLVLAAANEQGTEAPPIAAVVAFSPFVDMTLSGESMLDPNTRDPYFTRDRLLASAATYLGGADPRNARASPLFGIRAGLPPIAIQVGTEEVLLDDARRYARTAAKMGGTVRLDVYEGLHHVFQQSTDYLPSARRALDDAAAFLARYSATTSS